MSKTTGEPNEVLLFDWHIDGGQCRSASAAALFQPRIRVHCAIDSEHLQKLALC